MMSIRTNVASLNAQRNLTTNGMSLDSSMSRLSSGVRFTKAGADAAGLGISSNLTAMIRSYQQGARNAQDGMSLVESAEGALNESNNVLTRMRELAMQSASDGLGNSERLYIQNEAIALTTELDRIANVTEFNGSALFSTVPTSLAFQIGIRNVAANDRISVSTVDVTSAALGVGGVNLASLAGAQTALSAIDGAITALSTARSTFGAVGNRLQSVVSTIQTSSENLSTANGRIRDVDMAEESARLARSQVLVQASVSVLAQANQTPELALKLLS